MGDLYSMFPLLFFWVAQPTSVIIWWYICFSVTRFGAIYGFLILFDSPVTFLCWCMVAILFSRSRLLCGSVPLSASSLLKVLRPFVDTGFHHSLLREIVHYSGLSGVDHPILIEPSRSSIILCRVMVSFETIRYWEVLSRTLTEEVHCRVYVWLSMSDGTFLCLLVGVLHIFLDLNDELTFVGMRNVKVTTRWRCSLIVAKGLWWGRNVSLVLMVVYDDDILQIFGFGDYLWWLVSWCQLVIGLP